MRKKSIKKNYMYNLIYQILTLITPFITTPYLSRVLGANGVGTYSYIGFARILFFLRRLDLLRLDKEKSLMFRMIEKKEQLFFGKQILLNLLHRCYVWWLMLFSR